MPVDERQLLREAWERIAIHGEDETRQLLQREIDDLEPVRRRSRLVVGAIVLAALALVVAPAIGGNGLDRVVSFLSDDPPEEVVENLEHLDRGAPAGMGQQPVIGETKLVLRGWNQYGEYRLWLTPTEKGRVCLSFEAPQGRRTRPYSTTCAPRAVRRPVDNYITGESTIPGVGYLIGRVAPTVVELRLEYMNGQLERVPIQSGFFVASIPAERMTRGTDHPRRLVGLDGAGRVVGSAEELSRTFARSPFLAERPPISVVEQERRALSLPLGAGTAELHLSPSRLGGTCGRVQAAETTWVWFCGDPANLRTPIHLAVLRVPDADQARLLLAGLVRAGLELRFEYEDGAVERPQLVHGWFLAGSSPEHEQRGHRLETVVLADGAADVLRIPMATKDESLYTGPADTPPRRLITTGPAAPDWPLVATVVLETSRAGSARLEIRRKNEREWHERLLVAGRVVGGSLMRWFPDERDAPISAEWIPVLSPDGKHDASLFSGTTRRGDALRAVYADGGTEAVPLVAPAQPLARIHGFFLFEVTDARRERGVVRLEAVDRGSVAARYAIPAETGLRGRR
jgi:hypothetical protein